MRSIPQFMAGAPHEAPGVLSSTLRSAVEDLEVWLTVIARHWPEREIREVWIRAAWRKAVGLFIVEIACESGAGGHEGAILVYDPIPENYPLYEACTRFIHHRIYYSQPRFDDFLGNEFEPTVTPYFRPPGARDLCSKSSPVLPPAWTPYERPLLLDGPAP